MNPTSHLSDSQRFMFVEMFNQVAIRDQEFANRLPVHEFELAFDEAGDILIDARPFGVNIKKRYESLE